MNVDITAHIFGHLLNLVSEFTTKLEIFENFAKSTLLRNHNKLSG